MNHVCNVGPTLAFHVNTTSFLKVKSVLKKTVALMEKEVIVEEENEGKGGDPYKTHEILRKTT